MRSFMMYSSPNIIPKIKSRTMVLAEYEESMGQRKGANRVLVVKPEGKRPLGRPKLRWEDNIKINLQKVE
jgi:hypothetical protein